MKGRDIRRIRDGMKMSQSQFAEHVGVPVRTLQQWEQDRQAPRSSAIALLKLAESGALKRRSKRDRPGGSG
ncbi:MAG: helix-turn-helix domain-containing protein [Betaproteobacteria bacterium]